MKNCNQGWAGKELHQEEMLAHGGGGFVRKSSRGHWEGHKVKT